MLRLQGLGRGVDTEVRVTELIEPYVKKMLAERFEPEAPGSPRRPDGTRMGPPGGVVARRHRVHPRADRAGQLGVDFRIHDPTAVDNLVDGLIASASVLAAAQLVARRSGPTIGAISIPGLIAAGVGVVTWQRLVRRRHEHTSWVARARAMAEQQRAARTR
jgi:ubiquinone biosynthesis protein